MKQLLKKTTRLFGFTVSRTTSSFNNPLAEFNIGRDEFETRDGGFYLRHLDLFIDNSQREGIISEGYRYAKNIAQIAGGKFEFRKGELFLELNDLTFRINAFDELYILNEIFVDGCYNIDTKEQQCVMIDIGMNVGICSLYFAQRPGVKKVYSFEPFRETFDLAQANLALNGSLGKKVVPHNFGLARKDGVLEVDYSPIARGRMGINGVPADMVDAAREKRELQLKDAAAVMSGIFNENPSDCFVMKCDCEGAEYEILERLFEVNLLGRFSYCMIEWHYKSPQILIDQLKQSGFSTVSTLFDNHNAGMIYGFKK